MLDEWEPDPLVKPYDAKIRLRVLDTCTGKDVIVDDKECISFCNFSFLSLHKHPEVIKSAVDITDVYGVGSCGPRGFYGSIKPHMDLEKSIAEYMGTPDATIFSSSFQTVASVLPAFLAVGDVLVMYFVLH